jgi:hypothetical protein
MERSRVVTVRPVGAEEFDEVGEFIVTAYNSIAGVVADPDYDMELRRVAERAARVPVLVEVEDNVVLGSLTYVSGPGPYCRTVPAR